MVTGPTTAEHERRPGIRIEATALPSRGTDVPLRLEAPPAATQRRRHGRAPSGREREA